MCQAAAESEMGRKKEGRDDDERITGAFENEKSRIRMQREEITTTDRRGVKSNKDLKLRRTRRLVSISTAQIYHSATRKLKLLNSERPSFFSTSK